MQASLCGNDLRRNALRSGALFVAALLFTGTFAGAQQRNAQPADRLELAIMYSGSYANLSSGNNKFWLNGGTAELAGQIHRGLGVVCNLTGLHTANTGARGCYEVCTKIGAYVGGPSYPLWMDGKPGESRL